MKIKKILSILTFFLLFSCGFEPIYSKKKLENKYNFTITSIGFSGENIINQSLKNNLVNEFHLFRANFNIGKNGKPMLIKKQFSKLNLSLINKKKFRNNFYYKYYIR